MPLLRRTPNLRQHQEPPSESRDSVAKERTCPHCGVAQDIACFKRRSQREGQRESWCRSCINAADRERRARKRAGIIRDLGRHLRVGTPVEKTRAVVAETVRRLGGVGAVGAELASAYQRARSSRDRLSVLRLVLRMSQAAE